MKMWETCFRDGFAPSLPTKGLRALAVALETDDPQMIQGATTSPPPLACVHDWPVEAGCAIAFPCWKAIGDDATVGAVEEAFADACFNADNRLGGAAEGRWFLNWFDETPRDEMRRELGRVVADILAERTAQGE